MGMGINCACARQVPALAPHTLVKVIAMVLWIACSSVILALRGDRHKWRGAHKPHPQSARLLVPPAAGFFRLGYSAVKSKEGRRKRLHG
jgi:hypothetical protein